MIDLTVTPTDVLNFDTLLNPQRPVHFVGIGGAGMAPLAQALQAFGFHVSGSDSSDSAMLQQLHTLGIHTFVGHQATQVPSNAGVVYSTAIANHNPELTTAQQAGYPLLHRSQVLQALLHSPSIGCQTTIGLAGTHGKTTLTGMMDAVLEACHQPALVIAGGKLPSTQQNLRLNTQRHLGVAELDESDGSILRYAPTFTILSNLELDHADHYADGLTTLCQTFDTYFKNLASLPNLSPHPQTVVANANCPLSVQVVQALPSEVRHGLRWLWLSRPEATQSLDNNALYTLAPKTQVYCLEDLRSTATGAVEGTLRIEGGTAPLTQVVAGVPGEHNCWNAAQITMVAHALGLPLEQVAEGLLAFSGMGRRFERLPLPTVLASSQAVLVDDYGHHPTEVQVTIEAARQFMQAHGLTGQLKVWFQPHRYTRLKALWHEFTTCFNGVDELFLVDVYHAHEAPIEGMTSQALAVAVQAQGVNCRAVGSVAEAQAQLRQTPSLIHTGDCVLSMGAGDVTKLFRTL
ncbi:MAG: UDP-N-acetylmuramate--L-alanine ligase [Vampirovibrionales bacterium]